MKFAKQFKWARIDNGDYHRVVELKRAQRHEKSYRVHLILADGEEMMVHPEDVVLSTTPRVFDGQDSNKETCISDKDKAITDAAKMLWEYLHKSVYPSEELKPQPKPRAKKVLAE